VNIPQKLVAEWRQWLENFHHYREEGILGLGLAPRPVVKGLPMQEYRALTLGLVAAAR